MTNWQKFKKSCGPMDAETREAWKPMVYAMYYVGALNIIGGLVAVIHG